MAGRAMTGGSFGGTVSWTLLPPKTISRTMLQFVIAVAGTATAIGDCDDDALEELLHELELIRPVPQREPKA